LGGADVVEHRIVSLLCAGEFREQQQSLFDLPLLAYVVVRIKCLFLDSEKFQWPKNLAIIRSWFGRRRFDHCVFYFYFFILHALTVLSLCFLDSAKSYSRSARRPALNV
jgi:hypothetical protein